MISKQITKLRSIVVFTFSIILVVESASILSTRQGNLGVLLIAVSVLAPFFHIKQQKH